MRDGRPQRDEAAEADARDDNVLAALADRQARAGPRQEVADEEVGDGARVGHLEPPRFGAAGVEHQEVGGAIDAVGEQVVHGGGEVLAGGPDLAVEREDDGQRGPRRRARRLVDPDAAPVGADLDGDVPALGTLLAARDPRLGRRLGKLDDRHHRSRPVAAGLRVERVGQAVVERAPDAGLVRVVEDADAREERVGGAPVGRHPVGEVPHVGARHAAHPAVGEVALVGQPVDEEQDPVGVGVAPEEGDEEVAVPVGREDRGDGVGPELLDDGAPRGRLRPPDGVEAPLQRARNPALGQRGGLGAENLRRTGSGAHGQVSRAGSRGERRGI